MNDDEIDPEMENAGGRFVDKRRSVFVARGDLAAAGIVHTDGGGRPIWLTARIEPEPDGTPAVGFYLETDLAGSITRLTDGIAESLDDAATNIERLQQLMHRLDPLLSAWIAYHRACPDERADWVCEVCIARANELQWNASTIAEMTGGLVAERHILEYLTRSTAMVSHKLQHVLRALGLTFREAADEEN